MTLPSDESETKSRRSKKKRFFAFRQKVTPPSFVSRLPQLNFIYYEVKMPFDTLDLEAQLMKVGGVLYFPDGTN